VLETTCELKPLLIGLFPFSSLIFTTSSIMTAIRILSAVLLTLAAVSVQAQDAPPQQASPGTSTMTAAECAAARKARHDHGIERNYGPMPIKGCSPVSVAKGEAKGVTGHDHGKFHKNQ
jgi:hypothetical protein